MTFRAPHISFLSPPYACKRCEGNPFVYEFVTAFRAFQFTFHSVAFSDIRHLIYGHFGFNVLQINEAAEGNLDERSEPFIRLLSDPERGKVRSTAESVVYGHMETAIYFSSSISPVSLYTAFWIVLSTSSNSFCN